MKIEEHERGMLLSPMGDDTVASILERRLSWVRKARVHLAERQAEDLAAWNRLGAPRTPPVAADKPKRGRKPRPFLQAAVEAARPAVREIIHTEITAAMESHGGGGDSASAADGDTVYVSDATYEVDLYSVEDLPSTPATIVGVRIVNVERLVDRLQTLPAEIKKAAAKAYRAETHTLGPDTACRLPDAVPEIPAKVLRWAGQFIDAGWTYQETAHLFDVKARDLRLALGGQKEAA